jgi:NAD(P)-dependent dehydrogenase (short-subunit alcohol dehydrogenase family)
MTLDNRVAVITGAAGGLGAVVSHFLAARGANLALLGREPEKLLTLTKDLDLPDSRLYTRTLNLLDPLEANASAGEILAKFGRIDILLHLAGGWTGGKDILEASSDDLTFMLNQHVWTSFNVIQAFIPHLVRNRWGRAIMITSPFAARPNAMGGPYAIGKAGQEALMLTLSQELAGTGVTVNLIQVKTIDIKREKISAPSPKNSSWTTPEEVAEAILYLLSDEAGAVNGAKIPLFGSY